MRSPSKVLAAMSTPQRHKFESMELAKWREETKYESEIKMLTEEVEKRDAKVQYSTVQIDTIYIQKYFISFHLFVFLFCFIHAFSISSSNCVVLWFDPHEN